MHNVCGGEGGTQNRGGDETQLAGSGEMSLFFWIEALLHKYLFKFDLFKSPKLQVFGISAQTVFMHGKTSKIEVVRSH